MPTPSAKKQKIASERLQMMRRFQRVRSAKEFVSAVSLLGVGASRSAGPNGATCGGGGGGGGRSCRAMSFERSGRREFRPCRNSS